MRPELVLFDCDGVLVDSEPVTNRLLVRELAGYGLTLTEAEVDRDYVGGTMMDVAARARTAGAPLPEDWVPGFYQRMFAELEKGVPLIPGIEAVLDRLDAAGIPYAVGSNGPEHKMEITLGQRPAFRDRFKGHIYSAHTLGVAKPDPRLYLIVAEKMGVDPARAVVIDDSPAGCTAGVRANIPTWGFAAHDDGARLAAVGARVFHHMDELPGLLGL